MRVFVTGATGFIGGHIVRLLRDRGDEVVCWVRNPAKAAELKRLGAELHEGELTDRPALAEGMKGCDAVIHGAGVYAVGIPKSARPAMHEGNVEATENTLGAALDAGIGKVVYISTIAAFGNTRGKVVDESYEHSAQSFTSYYEQTKYEAHEVARRLTAEGLPCVIVQPGGVYGPKDHSVLGKQLLDFLAGRMPLMAFPDVGMNMVHVEDVAAGILLALDNGKPGEAYVLGAEITTMRGLMNTAAKVAGKRPPRGSIPTGFLKLIAPLGPVVGKVLGQPPNMRELISSADGVTFWAKHDKAMAELGYQPRGLEQGLRETFEAEGKL